MKKRRNRKTGKQKIGMRNSVKKRNEGKCKRMEQERVREGERERCRPRKREAKKPSNGEINREKGVIGERETEKGQRGYEKKG